MINPDWVAFLYIFVFSTRCFPTMASRWPDRSPQVFTFKWHMGHYGALSQKPQRGWCNNCNYAILDRGAWSRKVLPKPKVKNVIKTINKETGKVSYSGTPQLKQSQSWAQLISYCMFFKALWKGDVVHSWYPLFKFGPTDWGLTLKLLPIESDIIFQNYMVVKGNLNCRTSSLRMPLGLFKCYHGLRGVKLT